MDDRALKDVCTEAVDVIIEAGYAKPVTALTMAGKQELINTLMYHYKIILYRNKAVMDQLKAGLTILGVLDAMAKWPKIMEPFFVGAKQRPLTAGIVMTKVE